MELKELPEKLKKRMWEWMGRGYVSSHFWAVDSIYYVVVKHNSGDIYCLRLWETQTGTMLSQDNILYA